MECVSDSRRGLRNCTRLCVHHFSASTTYAVKHAYSQKHHEFEDKSHRDSTERVSCWIKGLENVGNSSRWGQLTKNPDYTNYPSRSQLVQTPVAVEKLFSRDFTNEIRSQVIE